MTSSEHIIHLGMHPGMHRRWFDFSVATVLGCFKSFEFFLELKISWHKCDPNVCPKFPIIFSTKNMGVVKNHGKNMSFPGFGSRSGHLRFVRPADLQPFSAEADLQHLTGVKQWEKINLNPPEWKYVLVLSCLYVQKFWSLGVFKMVCSCLFHLHRCSSASHRKDWRQAIERRHVLLDDGEFDLRTWVEHRSIAQPLSTSLGRKRNVCEKKNSPCGKWSWGSVWLRNIRLAYHNYNRFCFFSKEMTIIMIIMMMMMIPGIITVWSSISYYNRPNSPTVGFSHETVEVSTIHRSWPTAAASFGCEVVGAVGWTFHLWRDTKRFGVWCQM